MWVCLAGLLFTGNFLKGSVEKDSEVVVSVRVATDIRIGPLSRLWAGNGLTSLE